MSTTSNHMHSGIEEGHSNVKTHISISKGLTSNEAAVLLQIHGKNELEDKKTPKWFLFLQQFWAPMPIMIWIAAIVEVIIGNYPDFGILLAIQFINASLGFYEIVKVSCVVYLPLLLYRRKWLTFNSMLDLESFLFDRHEPNSFLA